MEKDKRICSVCRTSYNFCPRCNEDKPMWMFTWCSDNCRNIYRTLDAYDSGDMAAIDAKKLIDTYDLSRREYFGESYKRILEQLDSELEKVEPDFPYMNSPVEDRSPAIAEEVKEQKSTKTVSKIVKKSVALKTGKGDLGNS